MWKLSYEDIENLDSRNPEKYEDIGHKDGQGIPWIIVDDEIITSDRPNANHAIIIKELSDKYGKEKAGEIFSHSWRGRYVPEHHEMSITRWDAERSGMSVSPPPKIINLLKVTFPGVEHIWSFPGARSILGSFDQTRINRIEKHAKWHKTFSKIATKNFDDLNTSFLRDNYHFDIADVDRYATDKYSAEISIRETENNYSIGFQMYNYQVGVTGSSQYWHYKKNEKKQALATFKKIKDTLSKVVAEIEYTRPPMAVITPMVRAALNTIDVGKKERSGNYFYNWFKELPKEADWRKTLYGKRYPNSVVQTINAFWNKDENGKEIVVKGTNSRNRTLSYKQASLEKEAGVAELLKKYWGFAVPTAMALALTFTNNGGTPEQIDNAYQSGTTQQEVQQAIEQIPEEYEPEIVQDIPENEELHSDGENLPLGVRNNNPGNIVQGEPWEGLKTERNDSRFAVFETPEYGLRAMALLLRNYQREYKLNTIAKIISRWAPEHENPTDDYIIEVAKRVGVDVNQELNLEDDETLLKLMKAMIYFENGGSYYDDATILKGISMEKESSSSVQQKLAYQILDKFEAKSTMIQLMQNGTKWENGIPQILKQEGVAPELFGWLNNEYLKYISLTAGIKSWNYKFA